VVTEHPQAEDSGETRSVTKAVWRAGAVPAGVIGGIVTLLSIGAGSDAVVGAALGTLLAIFALSVPVLVVSMTAPASPPAVMAAALAGYLFLVIVLAMAWILLSGQDWLAPAYLGGTLIATTVAWMVGQVRGMRALRILAFGSAADSTDKTGDTPGRDGGTLG